MTFGLLPTGFVPKQLVDIQGEINAELLAKISQALNLSETALMGVFVGIFAEREANVWQLAQAVYNAMDPDQAENFSLDALSALTGTLRDAATRSLITGALLGLDAATTVPAGSIAAVDGNPAARFRLVADVTSTTAGDYPGDFEGEDTGPTVANAGTLTVIATPVTGWNSVTNPADAALGADIETDTHLRQKRENELAAAGTSTADAIRADLLEVEGIASCTVFLNDGNTTDVNGLPPHSVEVLIYDPLPVSNTVIAQAIWDAKAAGIETYSAALTSGTATDSEGVDHTMFFTRVTIKDVYLIIDIEVTGSYPVSGDTAVAAAVALYGDETYQAGDDVILSALYPSVFSVTGVKRIAEIKAGFSASPTATVDLAIGLRELADLDTSRISVVHV